LKNDEYAKYRDEAFIERLGVELEKMPLSEFWPKNGPQWDALGRSSSGKLFLVEAKSHISELISTLKAENENSIRKIQESLRKTKHYLNSRTNFDWSKGFYQYTNRLAHLYLLKENDLQAYLLFVYFMNDSEMNGPTSVQEWEGAVKLLHSCLATNQLKLKKDVIQIFIDVKHLQ